MQTQQPWCQQILFILLIVVNTICGEVYNCYECAGKLEDCLTMEACEESCTSRQVVNECNIQNFECATVSFSFVNSTTGHQQFSFERYCAPNHDDQCWEIISCAAAEHFNSTDCQTECCNHRDLCNGREEPTLAARSTATATGNCIRQNINALILALLTIPYLVYALIT